MSAALFEGNAVNVRGLPWCKDETKTIGLANLTAKILCKVHNENLSKVDSAGAAAFDVFRKVRQVANVRKTMTRGSWAVKRYQIDGPLLERWFLKTLINLCVVMGSSIPVGRDVSTIGTARKDLVETAFGCRAFRGRAGLYSVVRTGMMLNSCDALEFSPLVKNRHHIEGGLFTFRGFHYLLFLEEDGPPQPLDGVFIGSEDLCHCQLNFHNRKFEGREKGYLSQVVTIAW